MTKKILVADRVAKEGVEALLNKGYEVDVRPDLTHEEISEIIPTYDALVLRSGIKVTRDIIEAGKNLRVIGRAGVTVDNIDLVAASEHDIVVCNAPTSNIVSAAEHTFALLLACARNLPQINESMHNGEWDRTNFMGEELFEKTLAICGLGRIGALVAQRAKTFGMKLIGYDPYCSAERAEQLGVKLCETLEELLPQADFITVHMPHTESTVGMFGAKEFAAMKDGVILVNTAAGGIYQEKALSDFLAAGKVRAVGIDMFEEDPCYESPLHEFPNAILTPHIAAVTEEAQRRAGLQIAEYVSMGLEGFLVPTIVNLMSASPEMPDVLAPYIPACQMMGKLLAQLTGDMPQTLRVVAAGNTARSGGDLRTLAAAAIGGFLSYREGKTVTPTNAEALALRHGIRIETSSMADAMEYSSSVRVFADGVEAGVTLAGTARTARIISLFDYKMDIVPGNQNIVLEYPTDLGRIGAIGTVLGNAGINIVAMQSATNMQEHTSLAFVNVEGEITDEVIDELKTSTKALHIWKLSL